MEIVFEKVSCEEFHNLSFKIPEGSIIGVTGYGKSKFLKIINYLYKIEGHATYGTWDYKKENMSLIHSKICLVEQKFNNQFFLRLVEEYIVFIIQYYKLNIADPKRKVLDALKMVGLTEDYLEKELVTLSSSEKKLLQIAIALLANPTILLLDEPFINLDLKSQKKLQRLLLKLKERYHKTIVIASHDSNLLYTFTEMMIFLKNNAILRKGSTEDLYQNVNFLMRYHYEIPDIVLFTYKVKTTKNIRLEYHKDIRDLIKDVYRHV